MNAPQLAGDPHPDDNIWLSATGVRRGSDDDHPAALTQQEHLPGSANPTVMLTDFGDVESKLKAVDTPSPRKGVQFNDLSVDKSVVCAKAEPGPGQHPTLEARAEVEGLKVYEQSPDDVYPLLEVDRVKARLFSNPWLNFRGSDLKGLEIYGLKVKVTVDRNPHFPFRTQPARGLEASIVHKLEWEDPKEAKRILGLRKRIVKLFNNSIEIFRGKELIARIRLGVVKDLRRKSEEQRTLKAVEDGNALETESVSGPEAAPDREQEGASLTMVLIKLPNPDRTYSVGVPESDSKPI